MKVLLTENRALNKIEYHQKLLSYALGNEAMRNADKQARESITMDCSCQKHARKPQPEDEFRRVVPGPRLVPAF